MVIVELLMSCWIWALACPGKESGVECAFRGMQNQKFRHTTDSKHNLPVVANLPGQDFVMSNPDETWVCDISYVRVKQKWLYLAVVMELYSRKVIGWSMSSRINAKLVCDALKMALFARGNPEGVIVHSERGRYCKQKCVNQNLLIYI